MRAKEPPKSALAGAVGYVHNQWEALTRFLHDGAIPVSTTRSSSATREDPRTGSLSRNPEAGVFSQPMSSESEWKDLCEEVRHHRRPALSPAWPRLYELAVDLGVRILRSKWNYSSDDACDVVQDVLSTCWGAVLAADNPKAFFATVLVRHATTRWRKETRSVPTDAERLAWIVERDAPVDATVGAVHRDLATVVEWVLENLSARDARVLLHSVNGDTAAEIASREDLSIDNVHQIVHRTKKAVAEAFREST